MGWTSSIERSSSSVVNLIDSVDATVRINDPTTIALVPHVPLDSIRQLGSYHLEEQLGSGGMGIVFAARDSKSGELFAIKILRPSLIMDPEAKLRFSREAQAMAMIGHQRIVPIVCVGEDRGIPYIVMPLLIGETLEDRLRKSSPLPCAEVIRLGIEIAEGLDAAHSHDLIHRDVKPANVWLEKPKDSVRLLDLGLARNLDRSSLLTDSGVIMGTPAFMSPEQARGARTDPRSDLFSLGCIMYQLATGVRPFEGPTSLNVLGQIENFHPMRVCARNPAIPSMLSNLIMELLAKNPKDRPDSATTTIDRLQRIRAQDEPQRTPVVVAPPHTPIEIILPIAEDVAEDEPRRQNWHWYAGIFLTLLASLWYLSWL